VPELLERIELAMQLYFGRDQRRIDHARQVAGHAEELLRYIDADETVTMAAAFLHDIGIPEAERLHGSCAGPHQEELGPPVARAILQELAAPSGFIDGVCALIGRHHTPAGIDSPEFRILWDADALVNLAEVVPGKKAEEIAAILEKWLVTEAGYRRARKIYLP
jgi:HD superfamily phosphodiesterase